MLKTMDTGEEFTGPVNLGNPSQFTMVELSEKVLRLTASKSKMVIKPLPQDDPKQRKPDILLAKAKLNWQLKVALDDGLKRTVDYFKATLNL